MNVNRSDLIRQLVDKHRYTKDAATDVVDDFIDIVIDNIRVGNTVSIYGFGVFDILERAERSCPNPQTGERCSIPAHFIARFYPGTRLRKAVKMWEDDTKRGLM